MADACKKCSGTMEIVCPTCEYTEPMIPRSRVKKALDRECELSDMQGLFHSRRRDMYTHAEAVLNRLLETEEVDDD